jgi:hypothetical protein
MQQEKLRIIELCDAWEAKLEQQADHISDDIQGSIRSTIGMGRTFLDRKGANKSYL